MTILVVAMLPGGAIGANGNIGSNVIEVGDDANLYPSAATGCTGNAFNSTVTGFDWVKDCLENTDTGPEKELIVGTNAAAKKGHWNGFRVTDGIAGGDQDIFLTGGKENKLATWNPGPGTVGSSKYDITQAYIANNSIDAFFGMERRGNNGTTAFDWEFNKRAPSASNPDYIPTRSECDVLVTFEMQGSGKTGTATPYVFRYDDPQVDNTGSGTPKALDCATSVAPVGYVGDAELDGKYVAQSASGVVTSINNAPIHSAPWGTVDSGGSWITGDIDNFQFAEAKVPLTLLGISPGDTCTAISRYLQVRTRSSSTDTSDLKDLTKIQNFDFFAPTNPSETLDALCDAQFDFSSSLTSGPTPSWTFEIADVNGQPAGVSLEGVAKDGSTVTLSPDADGTDGVGKTTWTATAFSGRIQVTLPTGMNSVQISVAQSATSGTCPTSSNGTVTVYRGLSVSASATPDCDATFDWSTSVTGGQAPYDLTVKMQRLESGNWVTKSTQTFNDDADGALDTAALANDALVPYDATGAPGTYRIHVDVSDSQDPACTASNESSTFQVRDALTAGAVKDRTNTSAANLTVAMDGSQTGALAGDTIAYQWQKRVDSESADDWSDISTATTQEFDYGAFETDDTTPTAVDVTVGAGSAATGSYKGRVWVVQLRLKVTRTVSGVECVAYSSPVTVKMVKMVDP